MENLGIERCCNDNVKPLLKILGIKIMTAYLLDAKFTPCQKHTSPIFTAQILHFMWPQMQYYSTAAMEPNFGK